MDLPEARRTSTQVVLADTIRRWVALGTLEPGDRLPTERELAERLGAGRTTIRQAIRILEQEGLVSTVRGRSGGTFVLDDDERPTRGRDVTQQMLRDVRDNFDFRRGLEPMAARLAAERAAYKDRWAIRGLAEGKPASVRAFRVLDSRFHLAIAEASGNRFILDAISQSRAEFFGWADAAWESVDWAALPPGERDFGLRHRAVAEAIQDGDPDAAEARMVEHMIEGHEQFFSVIELAETHSPARGRLVPAVRRRHPRR